MSHGVSKELLDKYEFKEEEKAEIHRGYEETTGYPQPQYRERIIIESEHSYIEEAYYWIIDYLRFNHTFNKFEKITDATTTSASSAFFGMVEQRLGAQQDKAAGFLRGISEMVKSLFQLVRELRIIDERLGYYEHTFKRKEREQESIGSEISLKGIWIDQVEGGSKNAASVFGLATEANFVTLPDLFFKIRADDRKANEIYKDKAKYDGQIKNIITDIDQRVKSIDGFNEKVKTVLVRKLTQYYMWKLRTYRELRTRRIFTLKYLNQHYSTIKLYIGWIKPYLRNIKDLGRSEKNLNEPDIINSFEGSVTELEVLSFRKSKEQQFYYPCIIINFHYHTKPSLQYSAEGYNRGPAHTGKFEVTLRGYVWSENEIENYRRLKREEDLELISQVDESLKDSMDSLGDELKEYLRQSEETQEKDEEDSDEKQTSAQEFAENFRNNIRKTFFGPFAGIKTTFVGSKKNKEKNKRIDDLEAEASFNAAKSVLKSTIYSVYKNYKKQHRMLSW